MSTKTLLTLSVGLLLCAAVITPNAALAQFGPLQVLRLPSLALLLALGPVVPLRVSAPAGLRPDHWLVLRCVAPRAHLRAILPVVLVSMELADCTASIAAAGPIFAASRVAPRPTAPTATPAIVTPAMALALATVAATAVVTGTGLMRQPPLRVTGMAGPTHPQKTAAITFPPPTDTATGAFWSVIETD